MKTKAIEVVAGLLEQLDDAHPDVGMGYPKSHFVEKAKNLLKESPTDEIPSLCPVCKKNKRCVPHTKYGVLALRCAKFAARMGMYPPDEIL
jgi:hypothetical protein